MWLWVQDIKLSQTSLPSKLSSWKNLIREGASIRINTVKDSTTNKTQTPWRRHHLRQKCHFRQYRIIRHNCWLFRPRSLQTSLPVICTDKISKPNWTFWGSEGSLLHPPPTDSFWLPSNIRTGVSVVGSRLSPCLASITWCFNEVWVLSFHPKWTKKKQNNRIWYHTTGEVFVYIHRKDPLKYWYQCFIKILCLSCLFQWYQWPYKMTSHRQKIKKDCLGSHKAMLQIQQNFFLSVAKSCKCENKLKHLS